MPGMKVPRSFPGVDKLPGPMRSLVEMVFPQDPQSAMPVPGALGMAGGGKVLQGAFGCLKKVGPDSGEILQKMIKETAEGPFGPKFKSYLPRPTIFERGPKPGGVLYEVLERAGLKQGSGQALTPGENQLIKQFPTTRR